MTTPRMTVTRAGALLGIAVLAAAGAAQAAGAPTARVATTAFRTNVAPIAGGEVTLPYDQVISIGCRPAERAIAPGIASASHHLTAQSFGPSAVSGIVAGRPGTATTRLQALCLRNGKVVNRRVAGRLVPGVSGPGFGRVTATASCPRGFVAVGAPLSQDFAPGFGAFTSVPSGARAWRVVVHRAPDILAGTTSPGAYADVACVKVAGPSTVVVRGVMGPAGDLALTATCRKGRALGWGVDLGAYPGRTSGADGRWATPVVARAAFGGTRRVDFRFAWAAGTDAAGGAGVPVAAHVVCGTPKR